MQLNFPYPDDHVKGCTKYLLSIPQITNLVGQYDNGTPFIFQEEIIQNMNGISAKWPENPVTAIVVKGSGTWGTPSPQTTERFPKLTIEIWADPPRGMDGKVTRPRDARLAADYLYNIMDSYLNFTSSEVVMFGTQPVWRSYRLGDIAFMPKLNSEDDLVIGTVSYGLQTAFFQS
jgi:hypothetical protein